MTVDSNCVPLSFKKCVAVLLYHSEGFERVFEFNHLLPLSNNIRNVGVDLREMEIQYDIFFIA
jgi:hypothetical protein